MALESRVLDKGCHIPAAFGLLVELPTDCTELFDEDLFGMLGSLGLDEAKNFTSLLEVQLSPVANIHFEDVFLTEFDFG